ncbi:MAG TPA: S-layer homology domain-containing protein [Limnochordia bacterium]
MAAACAVAVYVVCGAGPAPAWAAGDVPAGHWTYDVIQGLIERNLVSGLGPGGLRPDETLSRYELAWLLGRAVQRMREVASPGAEESDLSSLANRYNAQVPVPQRLEGGAVRALNAALAYFRVELEALGFSSEEGAAVPGGGRAHLWDLDALAAKVGSATWPTLKAAPERPSSLRLGAAMQWGDMEVAARLQPAGTAGGLTEPSAPAESAPIRTAASLQRPGAQVASVEAVVTVGRRRLDIDALRAVTQPGEAAPQLSLGVEVPISGGSVTVGYSLSYGAQGGTEDGGDRPRARPEAGVAYEVSPKARAVANLALGDAAVSEGRAADFGLEYRLSPEVSVLLGYRLIDFGGITGEAADQRAKVASATFAVRF